MDYLGGWVNKTMQTLHFVSQISVLGPLNGAKRAEIVAKRRAKYKIIDFEHSAAFEVR